jgi:hypothetical protein
MLVYLARLPTYNSMTVVAFLLAVAAVLVVGITMLLLLLLVAHWLSVQIAKQIEKFIDSGHVVELDGGPHERNSGSRIA